MKQNNSGMSMLLVIAALLVTGFIGTSLIKMATADRLSGIYFSSSESARSAAKSGLTAALVRIGSTQQATKDSILAILNNYITTPNPDTLNNATNYPLLWINGGPNSAPADRQWQSLSSGSVEKFRTRIDAFRYNGPNDCYITLVSEGVGAGGSKSSAMGVYQLTNLAAGAVSAPFAMSALHLGQGAGEIIAPLKVLNGDVYVDNPSSYFANTGGAPNQHEIAGIFRTGEGTTTAFRMDNVIFHGPAYFKCPTTAFSGGENWFKQGAAFEKNVAPSQPYVFDSAGPGLFLNGGFDNTVVGGASAATCGPRMNGKPVKYRSTEVFNTGGLTTMDVIAQDESAATPVSDSMTDLAIQVGITVPVPPEVLFKKNAITPDTLIHSANTLFGAGNTVTGAALTAKFNDSTTYLHWKGYLVIQGVTGADPLFAATGTFTGKVIWIIENKSTVYGTIPEMSNTSTFLFYLNNTQVDNFRLPLLYRGLILSEGGSSSAESPHCFFGRDNRVNGAIVIKDRTFRLQSDGGPFKVFFDQTIINDYATAGIIESAGGASSSGVTSLTITGSRILPVVRSHAM